MNQSALKQENSRKSECIWQSEKSGLQKPMAESFCKALKHQYLKAQTVQNTDELRWHVEYYIREHNSVIPYAHLEGRTPEETLTGAPAPPLRESKLRRLNIKRDLAEQPYCRHCKRPRK